MLEYYAKMENKFFINLHAYHMLENANKLHIVIRQFIYNL